MKNDTALTGLSTHDKLIFAIGIIQDRILASDTGLSAEALFGGFRFDRSSLELCEHLLTSILGEVETLGGTQ